MKTPIQGDQGGGPEAERRGAPPASGLLYLLVTSSPEEQKVSARHQEKLLGSRTAIARKVDTLRRNLQDLIDRVGIERMGFMTLTFKDNIRDRKLAEKRFHRSEERRVGKE